MKRTIKEDLEEKYIRAVLIDDNHLLIYTENEYTENKVDVRIRTVEGGAIRDHFITSMPMKYFRERRQDLIEVNKDITAIAAYRIDEDNKKRLENLYIFNVDDSVIPEFMDIQYSQYFPEYEVSLMDAVVKKRGSKNGKH